MQKWILAVTLLVLNITSLTAQSYEDDVREYISQYKDLAMMEQQRSGIPASITLAQGIHETQAGKSELATVANNHFGIKCKKSWTGDTYTHTDDAPNECFRKYPSSEQSYRDHSDYLSTTPRYASLFTYSQTDYASWAFGLKKCGYATNPRYPKVLIGLIEDYKLQEYTYVAMEKKIKSKDIAKQKRENEIVPEEDALTASAAAAMAPPIPVASASAGNTKAQSYKRKGRIVVNENENNTPAETASPAAYPPYGDIVRVNGLKAVYAKQGDIPLEYALNTGLRYERLLEINEISDKPLPEDMYLYLERKQLKGIRPTHTVKEGETLAQVAQYEGMQQKAIRSLNKLEGSDEPAPGAVLQLQTEATAPPAIIAVAPPPAKAIITAEPPPPPAEAPLAANEGTEQPEPQVAEAIAADNTVTPPPAAEETPVADNTAIEQPLTPMPEPPPAPPVEEQPLIAQVETTDIGPAKPADIAPPATEVTETGNTLPNPPPPVNIANEKPIEETIAEEQKAKPVPPPKEEEPKDELDALKARFDKVVYAQKTATPVETTPAPAPGTALAETTTPPVAEAAPGADIAPEPQQPVASAKGVKFYVVKKGDTAFGIAKRNNITMRQLMDWNKLDFEAIKVGQRLQVKP